MCKEGDAIFATAFHCVYTHASTRLVLHQSDATYASAANKVSRIILQKCRQRGQSTRCVFRGRTDRD